MSGFPLSPIFGNSLTRDVHIIVDFAMIIHDEKFDQNHYHRQQRADDRNSIFEDLIALGNTLRRWILLGHLSILPRIPLRPSDATRLTPGSSPQAPPQESPSPASDLNSAPAEAPDLRRVSR